MGACDMSKMLLIEDSGLSIHIAPISPTITEAVDKDSHMVLRGVPATILDEPNGNDRKYTEKEFKRSISKATKEGAFASRKLLCSANDHPESSFVPPGQASHVVLKAYTKKLGEGDKAKTYLLNDWLVFDTTSGKNLQSLVKAGASFGTSIRGLGQLNETSKEVENYDFLGCDAVGNPSAGTFASREQFEVTVESAPVTLINQVKESLEDKTMSFNLQEKIVEFKKTHFKEGKAPTPVSPEVMASLTSLQREAVENAVDTAELEALYDELFGESIPVDTKKNFRGRVRRFWKVIIQRACLIIAQPTDSRRPKGNPAPKRSLVQGGIFRLGWTESGGTIRRRRRLRSPNRVIRAAEAAYHQARTP
jgi:Prohead core protein serine protease